VAAAYETISLVRRGAVHYLSLNRPDRHNCMTPRMVEELLHYWGERLLDEETRLVVFSGSGDHFTAGLDLKEPLPVLDTDAAGTMRFMRDFGEIIVRMRRCPQPIVIGLKGIAAGGGLALALASDIRIAGASMRTNAAFVRLGLSGTEMGVSYLLPRLVGAAVAADLCLTGRLVGAEEAFSLGLVSRVVPDEDMAEAIEEVVAQILANDAFAIRLTKEALNASLSMGSLDAAIAMENRNQSLAFLGGAPREAVRAFLESRSNRVGR